MPAWLMQATRMCRSPQLRGRSPVMLSAVPRTGLRSRPRMGPAGLSMHGAERRAAVPERTVLRPCLKLCSQPACLVIRARHAAGCACMLCLCKHAWACCCAWAAALCSVAKPAWTGPCRCRAYAHPSSPSLNLITSARHRSPDQAPHSLEGPQALRPVSCLFHLSCHSCRGVAGPGLPRLPRLGS